MRNLDLDFLMNICIGTHTLTSHEIQILVANVMSVLRSNRGTGKLSDDEVMVGNRFILAMNALITDNGIIELNITPEDLQYILEENHYMRMGNGRN